MRYCLLAVECRLSAVAFLAAAAFRTLLSCAFRTLLAGVFHALLCCAVRLVVVDCWLLAAGYRLLQIAVGFRLLVLGFGLFAVSCLWIGELADRRTGELGSPWCLRIFHAAVMVVDTTCQLVSCLEHTEVNVLFNKSELQFNDGVLLMQGRESNLCSQCFRLMQDDRNSVL